MTMLDRMRRHRGWLKWSLGLVAVTMVIFFIPQDYLRPTTTVGAAPSETIAEVEGRSLTAGDFQQRYLQQVSLLEIADGQRMAVHFGDGLAGSGTHRR